MNYRSGINAILPRILIQCLEKKQNNIYWANYLLRDLKFEDLSYINKVLKKNKIKFKAAQENINFDRFDLVLFIFTKSVNEEKISKIEKNNNIFYLDIPR